MTLLHPLQLHTVPEPPATPPPPPAVPPPLPEIDDPPSPHPADPVIEPGAPPPPVANRAPCGQVCGKSCDAPASRTPASSSSDLGCLRLSQRYNPLPSTTIVMRSSSAQTIFSGKPP
jgi:hypothetical protein